MDKPLTEMDKRVGSNYFDKADVQSAKRLLKRKISLAYFHPEAIKKLLGLVDACFQIDGGDDKVVK